MAEISERAIRQLKQECAEDSLSCFIRQAWHVIDPAAYIHGRHIDVVSEHLEAFGSGEIETLLIMLPPGYMKSIMVSVMFPAWQWINNPQDSFLSASHSLTLSRRDNVKCRRLLQSQWYQDRWSDSFNMEGDQNAKDLYQNDKMGFREIASIDGTSTGKRAKFRTIDDAIGAVDALNEKKIKSVNNWYDTEYKSRYEDPKRKQLLAVAQRLAEGDIMGHLMDVHPNADVLCFPARYEKQHPVPARSSIKENPDWRTEEGQLLFPERFDEEEQDSLESSSTDFVIASQYQQRPDTKGGNVVKTSWWKYYDSIPPNITRRVIYADTAQEVGDANDYTVFQCWGLVEGRGIFLLDMVRDKVESPELRALAKSFWDKHRNRVLDIPPVSIMKIEKKSSGSSLIQDLKRIDRVNVEGIERPRGKGKANRMIDFSPKIKEGFVFIPSSPTQLTDASWVIDYLAEFRQFRLDDSHKHDDQIDPTLDAIDDLLMNKQTNLLSGLYGKN